MKLFVLISIFISLSSLWASEDYEKAKESMINDFKPFIKTLSREIYTYHWYDEAKFTSSRNTPFKILKWSQSAWGKYFSTDAGDFGMGLYAAYDPFDSSEYGEHLLRIRVLAGTKFLDIRSIDTDLGSDEIPMSRKTLSLLGNIGCYLNLKGQGVVKREFAKYRACHNILIDVVKELEIDFFTYRWGAGTDSVQVCDGRDEVGETPAFLFAHYKIKEDYIEKIDSNTELLKLKEDDLFKDKIFGCQLDKYPEDKTATHNLNPVIKIISASFGENIDSNFKGNVTDKAGAFCDGKTTCTYMVSPRFIDDPAPDQEKSFHIQWKCTNSEEIHNYSKDAPSTDHTFDIKCEP